MPNLGERKKADFKSKTRTANEETKTRKSSRSSPSTVARAKGPAAKGHNKLLDDEDYKNAPEEDDNEEEEEDDDIIAESVRSSQNKGGMNIKLILGVVLVVVAVVAGFLVFHSKKPADEVPEIPEEYHETEQQSDTSYTPSEPSAPEQTKEEFLSGIGTQNFLTDENHQSDSPLTDPNDFVKDLYGLTTKADYTVQDIYYAADFVNYTKHRGTWGGGIELYYLDVDYKGTKYVIQVPFRYYKELDEMGIVPVKMEVLKVLGETHDQSLTVISYMVLDAETLDTVLKSQSK